MLNAKHSRIGIRSQAIFALALGCPKHNVRRRTSCLPIIVFALAEVCASHMAHAAGPDCNPKYYADSQHLAACKKRAAAYEQYEAAYAKYKAASDSFSRCVTGFTDPYFRTLNAWAVLYPRFGIAYRELHAELKTATDTANEHAIRAAVDKANQRFTDRILRTAEPEALEFYNLYQLKLKQQVQSCGPAPVGPKPPPN